MEKIIAKVNDTEIVWEDGFLYGDEDTVRLLEELEDVVEIDYPQYGSVAPLTIPTGDYANLVALFYEADVEFELVEAPDEAHDIREQFMSIGQGGVVIVED